MPPSKNSSTDILQRLASLEELAKDTFETEKEAIDWMNRPHPLLNGESPLNAAKISSGALRVREILVAIKHGGAV